MKTSFYSDDELRELGLASYGRNVLVSRKASLYSVDTIKIGDFTRIDDFSILSGPIELGRHVHVGSYCGLLGGEGIVLEDFTGISPRVTIFSATDDFRGEGLTGPTLPLKYRHLIKGKVKLEKHVIVGSGSVILPGVTIGCGAAVGALSLVNSNCEPWKIYVGVPARPRGNRKKEIIQNYESALEAEENTSST